MDYYQYIVSPEWKQRADAAKKRAGYKCQVCNGTHNLNAHHRTYEHLGREWPDDITVLCRMCHALFSKQGKLVKPPKRPVPNNHIMIWCKRGLDERKIISRLFGILVSQPGNDIFTIGFEGRKGALVFDFVNDRTHINPILLEAVACVVPNEPIVNMRNGDNMPGGWEYVRNSHDPLIRLALTELGAKLRARK